MLPSRIVAVVDRALLYPKAERWPDVDAMRTAWQEAHPHWLPSLPPPRFVADPAFLDSSDLLDNEEEQGSEGALFDPRTDLFDSVKPRPPKPPRLPKQKP